MEGDRRRDWYRNTTNGPATGITAKARNKRRCKRIVSQVRYEPSSIAMDNKTICNIRQMPRTKRVQAMLSAIDFLGYDGGFGFQINKTAHTNKEGVQQSKIG